jgi:hypothetical protein
VSHFSSRITGPNAVTTATTYPPGIGYAYVTVQPGEYSITITGPIDKGNAEIKDVYLEGATIYHYPPHKRKDSFGNHLVNLTAAAAKQPLGSGEWDYWIAILICFGEATGKEEGPEITSVTLPGSLVVGQRQPYDVDFQNAKGGANSISIAKNF